MYHFLLGLRAGEAEAQDVAAETWLRLWALQGTLRLPTVCAYLMAIAKNLFLEHSRRECRRAPLDFDVQEPHDVERDLVVKRNRNAV